MPLVEEVISRCYDNLIHCRETDASARQLGDIAIQYNSEQAVSSLWDAIHNTRNIHAIVDHCAFTIGRVVWEPEYPALEKVCFDIFDKSSLKDEAPIVAEKFSYTVGEVILRTANNNIRQLAVKVVTDKQSSPCIHIREYYRITRNRVYNIAKIAISSPTEVFLSYAKEDYKYAKKIYDNLQENGVNVWFDRVSLLPGQQWRDAIKKSIKDCRYFLALLSSNSISKKGFVQKELKIALEELEKYPDDDIYIIPVRIDRCIIQSQKLKELHWINMFESFSGSIELILKTVRS